MMPKTSSRGEQCDDGSAVRVAITITGDLSLAEQVDVIATFEQLSRDARHGLRCARYRIDARVKADGLSIVDGVMILEDGRVLLDRSVNQTTLGAVRQVNRRLRAQ